MTWIVVYDIESDRIRSRIADYCLDKGLERVQYSCFLGRMTNTLAKELAAKCAKALGKQPGKIRLVPICEKDLAGQIQIEVLSHE